MLAMNRPPREQADTADPGLGTAMSQAAHPKAAGVQGIPQPCNAMYMRHLLMLIP